MSNEFPDRNLHVRNRPLESELELVEFLCKELYDLSNKTDPMKGSSTEKGKDLAAFTALNLVGEICNTMAQWAIDHQLGLAHKGLSFAFLQPNKTNEHPEYLSQLSEVDSHEHEIWGANYRNLTQYNTRDYSGDFLRKLMENLVRANPLFLPDSIMNTYLEAFKAAKFNASHPFFEYNETKHAKNKHSKLRLQLKALAHVEYRKKMGTETSINIQETVAEAYGIESRTIRGFKPALLTTLGSLEVDRTLAFATNAAINIMHRKSETTNDNRTQEYNKRFILSAGAEYNSQALEKDGCLYQQLELSGKKSKKE